MLLLRFDVSIDVHLNVALVIRFPIYHTPIVITSINSITLASTIDLLQSLSVTHTHTHTSNSQETQFPLERERMHPCTTMA